jgi:hypothetical protein
VVLPASLLLNCEKNPLFLFVGILNCSSTRWKGFQGWLPGPTVDILLTSCLFLAVVALAVDVVLLLLPKRICLFRG